MSEQRLGREKLVRIVEDLWNPSGRSECESEALLAEVAANCPDPAGAWDLFVDPTGPQESHAFVDRALAMPPRDPSFLGENHVIVKRFRSLR